MKRDRKNCSRHSQKIISGMVYQILLIGAVISLWPRPGGAIELLNPRQWDNSEITSIQTNVDNIKNSLQPNGDIRTVAEDIREQLQTWAPYQDKAELLTDAVEDILNWLDSRRDDYIGFIGGDLSNKCPAFSDCSMFKSDLITFFRDIADLPPEIEAIQKFGFRDASVTDKIISNMPPIIMFGLNERLKHVPDWQFIPADIKDVFDEIADPEVFSLRLNDQTTTTLAATNQVGPLDRTKTQRFCRLRADKLDSDKKFDGVDPIRLNRLTLILSYFEAVISAGCDATPEDVKLTGTILGEGAGSAVTYPVKQILCYVAAIPKIIAAALQTHRANISLCLDRFAEIEDRLASCAIYTDFTLDAASNEEYYDLVMRRLTTAFHAGVPTSLSVMEYNSSITFLNTEDYASAYQHLCKAYEKIGIGDTCDPEMATDPDNPVECRNQGAEICNDLVDNDGDGKIDCADKADCRRDPVCN